jgi:hypothetical protein
MGFCYPGAGENSGDKPPRPECAPLWHERLLKNPPDLRLTLLVGQYAQRHLLRSNATRLHDSDCPGIFNVRSSILSAAASQLEEPNLNAKTFVVRADRPSCTAKGGAEGNLNVTLGGQLQARPAFWFREMQCLDPRSRLEPMRLRSAEIGVRETNPMYVR